MTLQLIKTTPNPHMAQLSQITETEKFLINLNSIFPLSFLQKLENEK